MTTVQNLVDMVTKAGSHFFDNGWFHKCKPIVCGETKDGKYIVWIERYRSAYLGSVKVQEPHDRIFAIDKMNPKNILPQLLNEGGEQRHLSSRVSMKLLNDFINGNHEVTTGSP